LHKLSHERFLDYIKLSLRFLWESYSFDYYYLDYHHDYGVAPNTSFHPVPYYFFYAKPKPGLASVY